MGVVSDARKAARAAVVAEIVAEARRQLAAVGAAALSLRAVARELGIASSAIYRYVASRDELLTALIVNGYNALGEAAEAAEAESAGMAARTRWRMLCRSVRAWSLAHPQEYILLYGSPVPGYQAPETTVGPASRVTLVLARVLFGAFRTGELTPLQNAAVSPVLEPDARRLADMFMPGGTDVPLEAFVSGLVVWAELFGQITFEVFGRLQGMISDTGALFDHSVELMADQVGLARHE